MFWPGLRDGRRTTIALSYDGKLQTFAAAPMGELVAAFQPTHAANIDVGRPMSTGARFARCRR
jgi:hypothetical protein